MTKSRNDAYLCGQEPQLLDLGEEKKRNQGLDNKKLPITWWCSREDGFCREEKKEKHGLDKKKVTDYLVVLPRRRLL